MRTLLSPRTLRRPGPRAAYYAVLAAMVLLFLAVFVFPLYWMVAGALKSPAELALPKPTLVPREAHPGAFPEAWTTLQVARYLFNTTLYAFGGWLFQVTVDVGVAYALSKLRPVGGRLILGGMLASLMLPATALLIPSYLVVSDLGLLNTPWALWLPAAANAFNIYLLKRFFDQIPDDLLDAASIDGAGRLRTLWHVVLPLSRPILAVVSIFAVIGIWKDFLWPLLVLQDPGTQTISVALHRLADSTYVPLNQMMAGLVLASIPMIVIFVVFQRHILSGLTAGGIKE